MVTAAPTPGGLRSFRQGLLKNKLGEDQLGTRSLQPRILLFRLPQLVCLSTFLFISAQSMPEY